MKDSKASRPAGPPRSFEETLIRVPGRDDVLVLNPGVGPDVMAILGARMSRDPDLRARWEEIAALGVGADWSFTEPPRGVREHLESCVRDYGHASIGSLGSAIWLYLSGFGWPATWLIQDHPLFEGQEVSSRAYDLATISGAAGPGSIARYAPPQLAELHAAWLKHYDRVRAQASDGEALVQARRWLPGTTPTGVILTGDVRAISRNADYIRALGGAWIELSDQIMSGVMTASPVLSESLGWRQRSAPSTWKIPARPAPSLALSLSESVELMVHDAVRQSDWFLPWEMGAEPRASSKSYLDVLWKWAPRLKLTLRCSVSAARDWHRHRPVMPWRLSVLTDASEGLLLAPWHNWEGDGVQDLLRRTSEAYWACGGREGKPKALHAVPFGGWVELQAVGSLPELLYMLELRATSEGSSEEVRLVARSGLQQLCELLPKEIVAAEQMDAALS